MSDRPTLERQLHEVLTMLSDLEMAVRIWNPAALQKGMFIWSQRKDHILSGEETWADQKFDPAWQPNYVTIDVDGGSHE